MRSTILIGVLGLLACATGCATVTRGDSQKFSFNTDPAGADVKVVTLRDSYLDPTTIPVSAPTKPKGETLTGTTPVTLKIKRTEHHMVTISKPGYRPIMFTMKAQWDGATLGNVIIPGGSIGAATDRVSGADLAFYKLPAKIKLTPSSDPNPQVIRMYPYRGNQFLTQEEYDKAVEEERREAMSKEILF